MIQVSSGIEKYYSQERDWTCGYAALRTLLNATHYKNSPIIESEFVRFGDELGFKPGPRSAEDLKNLAEYFGCKKYILLREDIVSTDMIELLKDYVIAIESELFGGHWFIVMDIQISENKKIIRLYDSYYDSIVILSLNQFYSIWKDDILLNTKNEYIAVRKI